MLDWKKIFKTKIGSLQNWSTNEKSSPYIIDTFYLLTLLLLSDKEAPRSSPNYFLISGTRTDLTTLCVAESCQQCCHDALSSLLMVELLPTLG